MLPAIGAWVSSGELGIYETPGNGAPLVCASKGASPVCVGPRNWLNLTYIERNSVCLPANHPIVVSK